MNGLATKSLREGLDPNAKISSKAFAVDIRFFWFKLGHKERPLLERRSYARPQSGEQGTGFPTGRSRRQAGKTIRFQGPQTPPLFLSQGEYIRVNHSSPERARCAGGTDQGRSSGRRDQPGRARRSGEVCRKAELKIPSALRCRSQCGPCLWSLGREKYVRKEVRRDHPLVVSHR